MSGQKSTQTRRSTSIEWPTPVDARLRILVNLAAEELGRPTSAAEVLAGLIVQARLDGKRAAKAAQAASPRKLRAIERENAEHAERTGPQLGRPRAPAAANSEDSPTSDDRVG